MGMAMMLLDTEEYKNLVIKANEYDKLCKSAEKVDKAEETTKEKGCVVFNNKKEIEKYYNANTNTCEFVENGGRLDVKFNFDLKVGVSNIYARNIYASNIDANNINAHAIYAYDIDANNIKAHDIKANNMDAHNIDANNIDARNICYYASCIAYNSLKCKSIER